MAIRSPFLENAAAECKMEYGLPRQRARWLAMTCFLSKLKNNLASTRILSDSIKIRKKLIDFDHPLC